MSTDDFDLESLARYLHLSPTQVLRLVERGGLPGRRVNQQWRFASAEIHHWLEDRLGAGGEEEMSHVETVLDRKHGKQESITIASLLPIEAIEIPLQARTKNSVLSSMVDRAVASGLLWDGPAMLEAVKARESLHSTALEEGAALLHPRRPLPQIIADSFLALGVTGSGIPFGDERGRLTDVFFLICSYDDAEHLRILARLSRLIKEPDFLASLRTAADPCAAAEAVATIEFRVFPVAE